MKIHSTHEDDDEQELYNEAPCGYCTCEISGKIVRMNNTFRTWLCTTSITPEPTSFIDVLTIGGKMYYQTHFLPLLLMQNYVSEIAFDIQYHDAEFPILCNAKYSPRKNIIYITIFNTTQRKLYEQELRRMNKLSETLIKELEIKNLQNEKAIFHLVHDIIDPLNNILVLNAFLQNQTPINPDTSLSFELIEQSCNHILDLSKKITNYYKSNEVFSYSLEEIELQELWARIDSIVNPDKKYTIRYPESNQIIIVNYFCVQNILQNLITNAIKFTFSTEVLVNVYFAELDDVYEFTVQDFGCGISEENMKILFEAFALRGSKNRFGTVSSSVGLALTKKLLTEIRGTLSVTSTVGIGSTFTFTLSKNTVEPIGEIFS